MCYCFFDRCSLNYRRKKLKKKSRHRLYLRQKKYAEFKNKENVFDLYFTSTCKELFFEKNVRILKQYKNNHKTIIQKKKKKRKQGSGKGGEWGKNGTMEMREKWKKFNSKFKIHIQ